MRAGDITRRSEILGAAVFFVVFVLVGAAVNVPVAVMLMNVPTPFQGGAEVDLSGAAAPTHWPLATPEPWPAPNLWQEWWSTGVRRIVVRSVDPPETYSMEIRHYGWPAPVIETSESQREREG